MSEANGHSNISSQFEDCGKGWALVRYRHETRKAVRLECAILWESSEVHRIGGPLSYENCKETLKFWLARNYRPIMVTTKTVADGWKAESYNSPNQTELITDMPTTTKKTPSKKAPSKKAHSGARTKPPAKPKPQPDVDNVIARLLPIGSALAIICASITEIGKDRTNQAQGFDFRGVDDLLNYLGPLFHRHGVTAGMVIKDQAFTSELVEKQGNGRTYTQTVTRCRVTVAVRLTDYKGDYREFEGVGEGLDHNGDKATTKAQSIAFKYALLLGLAIPVKAGTLEDGDAGNITEPESPQQPQRPASKPKSKPAETKAAEARETAKAKEADSPAKPSDPYASKPPIYAEVRDMLVELGATKEKTQAYCAKLSEGRAQSLPELTNKEISAAKAEAIKIKKMRAEQAANEAAAEKTAA